MRQVDSRPGLFNPELQTVLHKAQGYAQRLNEREVGDFHVLRELLGLSSVQAGNTELKDLGVNKNSVDLAVRSIFGKGSEVEDKDATISSSLRRIYKRTATVAAQEGRLAGPLDMFDIILANASIATRMILDQIVQEHVQRTGAPNVDNSLSEVWEYSRRAVRRSDSMFVPAYNLEYGNRSEAIFTPAGMVRVQTK